METPAKMRRICWMVSRPDLEDIPTQCEDSECESVPSYTADNEALVDIVE